MTTQSQNLKARISEKDIILFGATTSARDIMETELLFLNASVKYICDFSPEKWDKPFENAFQEVFVRPPEKLREESPGGIFVIITTLFDKEVSEYLGANGITGYMSAREILNETINVAEYWNDRYKKGYGTGVQTTGYLLEKQVEFVNAVITENNIETVFELGCGDGKMIPLLKLKNYVGVDIAQEAVKICREKFKDDSTKQFYTNDEYEHTNSFELALSLGNVIPSLPDDCEYQKYMNTLFNASSRFVCIFSSDFDGERFGHIRARGFSKYVEEKIKGWQLTEIKETGYKYKEGDPLDAKFYVYSKRPAQ